MYEIARGPLMWIAAIICIAGLTYRAFQLFRITRRKRTGLFTAAPISTSPARYSAEEQKLERLAAFQNSVVGKHPVMTIVSTVFHVCLFVTPVFLVAHNLLLYESWGVMFITLPDAFLDMLTAVFLACALFFLIRRIMLPRVRAVSTWYDYLLLFITAAPYLTGFFAYHQFFDYKTVITLHLLAGEAMLIAIPFTKLGHMVFFFFIRLLFGSEFSFGRGTRTWST